MTIYALLEGHVVVSDLEPPTAPIELLGASEYLGHLFTGAIWDD